MQKLIDITQTIVLLLLIIDRFYLHKILEQQLCINNIIYKVLKKRKFEGELE